MPVKQSWEQSIKELKSIDWSKNFIKDAEKIESISNAAKYLINNINSLGDNNIFLHEFKSFREQFIQARKDVFIKTHTSSAKEEDLASNFGAQNKNKLTIGAHIDYTLDINQLRGTHTDIEKRKEASENLTKLEQKLGLYESPKRTASLDCNIEHVRKRLFSEPDNRSRF